MPNWLTRLRAGRKQAPSENDANAFVLELEVVEGSDAGQHFTLEGAEVAIGRAGARGQGDTSILLHDPTVSHTHAVFRRSRAGYEIVHEPRATNPTLVNGEPVDRAPIRPGDLIQLGHVVIQVNGGAYAGLRATGQFTESIDLREASDTVVIPALESEETTQIKPPAKPTGHLVLTAGTASAAGRRFAIRDGHTLLGRSQACDVQISDLGISRKHAELVWKSGRLVLIHHSQVNQTHLNGGLVTGEVPVTDGDEIQLAGQVTFRVEIDSATDGGGAARDGKRSLQEAMQEKIERDRQIAAEFSVDGSFLDVDVVDSFGMKKVARQVEHIVVSFSNFRQFVSQIVVDFDGQVLNSNGDELMCFFDSAERGVAAAREILAQLDDFNEDRNLLERPFRFRLGIHTGVCLVDRQQGVAYSPVLDIAGHLQKAAPPNGLLISEQTFAALPAGLPFEPAGTLDRHELDTYLLSDSAA